MKKGQRASEETRRKMREAKTGYIPWNKGRKTGVITLGSFTKGHIPWNKGVKGGQISDETRKKMSRAGRERASLSLEIREKISKARMGHPYYPPSHDGLERWKAKMRILMTGKRNPRFGKKGSNEERRKKSEAHKGLHHSEETILRIKSSNLGKKRSDETRKRISLFRLNNPNKVFRDTKIELAVEAELKNRGIVFRKQVPLHQIARVDFFLPELMMVIQCDGCYWHGCPTHFPEDPMKRRPQDERQDIALKSKGLTIYRFWEHEINKSVGECLDGVFH